MLYSILDPSFIVENIVLNWWFWSSFVEEVIPRYLHSSLICSSNISYVLWSSESVTEIVLFLLVGGSTYEPLLSWVQAMIVMQHFDISNSPPEVFSSSFQDWAACWMLLVIFAISLFSQSFAYCVFSSRKPRFCLVYVISLFRLEIVQPFQCFSIAFTIDILWKGQVVLEFPAPCSKP